LPISPESKTHIFKKKLWQKEEEISKCLESKISTIKKEILP